MAETVIPKGGMQDSGNTHPLWMLMTALSGVSDELERARLMATGLPSLLPCSMSGVALVDESEKNWNLVVQKDGHHIGSPQTEQIRAELEPLFQEALRKPTLLIATANDQTDHTRIPPSIEKLGTQSLAVAPLRTLRHRLGMVLAGRETLERFSREDELVLSTLAQNSAIVFENFRLYQAIKQYSQNLQGLVEERTEKLRQAEERHRLLLEINNAIIANLDKDSLLHTIAETLRKVLRFDRATLTLLDSATDVLKVHALATTSPAKRFLTVGMEFPRQGSPLAPVYENKQPLIRHHLEQGPLIGIENNIAKEGILSYLAVPLMAKGEPFGTLNLGSREPEAYSPEDAELLMEVGQQVALGRREYVGLRRNCTTQSETRTRKSVLTG